MSKVAARKPKPKPKPAVRDLFLRYEPPVTYVRILEMREALESGRELTPAMRLELDQALSVLRNFIWLQELARARMHPSSEFATHWAVMVAAALVNQYGVLIKTAVKAALPDGDNRAVDRVKRAYSKWKKERPGVRVFAVVPSVITEEVAARLTQDEIKKGATLLARKQQKGN
jgi:hypothetical protein